MIEDGIYGVNLMENVFLHGGRRYRNNQRRR